MSQFFKPGQDIPLYGNLSTQFNYLDKLANIPSIGTISDFKPASNFGIGPGIAKETFGFIERYRAGKHEKFGEDHINLEYISPITLKPLINVHIDMGDY